MTYKVSKNRTVSLASFYHNLPSAQAERGEWFTSALILDTLCWKMHHNTSSLTSGRRTRGIPRHSELVNAQNETKGMYVPFCVYFHLFHQVVQPKFPLKFDNGVLVIARILCVLAGVSSLTTVSEVDSKYSQYMCTVSIRVECQC